METSEVANSLLSKDGSRVQAGVDALPRILLVDDQPARLVTSIHIPLAREEKTDADSATSESGYDRRRILVVDDNEDAADSLAALLEIDGQQSTAVYTPEAALEQVGRMKPDLVLLDIGLPRMSGYEVVQRIKATHPSIYVIALSGYGSAEDKQRAAAAGFDEHLVKPVDFEVLKQLLNRSWSKINPHIS